MSIIDGKMAVSDLATALREGKVNITFTKKDGTTTTRLGTLNDEVMAKSGLLPKLTDKQATARKENPAIQVYFEVDTKQFKSFLKANLVKWEPVKELKAPKTTSKSIKEG
jgi:hypothetical protein